MRKKKDINKTVLFKIVTDKPLNAYQNMILHIYEKNGYISYLRSYEEEGDYIKK